MIKIVLIGASGIVGQSIYKSLNKIEGINIIEITSENYKDYENIYCDVLINANGESRKSWCNQNPKDSLIKNCLSIYEYIKRFIPKRYILISSVDVYNNTSSEETTSEDTIIDSSKLSIYGMHKYFTELIIRQQYENHLIIRLSAVISNDIYKNVLFDLTRRESIYISPSSELNFIGGNSIGKFIKTNLFSSKYKVINLASTKSIKVDEIIKILNLEKEYINCLSLPTEKYIINTDRLKSLINLESSKDYVLEYLHNQNIIS